MTQELYEKEKDLPCINIRVNVDKNNKNEIFELLHYLGTSPIAKYATPYVAAVTDAEDTEHVYTLTQTEYNKVRERFLKEAEELGYSIGYGAFYPRRILSNCLVFVGSHDTECDKEICTSKSSGSCSMK